jgi:hypothetical protein
MRTHILLFLAGTALGFSGLADAYTICFSPEASLTDQNGDTATTVGTLMLFEDTARDAQNPWRMQASLPNDEWLRWVGE